MDKKMIPRDGSRVLILLQTHDFRRMKLPVPHLAGNPERWYFSWPNVGGLVLLPDLLITDYITGNFLDVLHIITHVVFTKVL